MPPGSAASPASSRSPPSPHTPPPPTGRGAAPGVGGIHRLLLQAALPQDPPDPQDVSYLILVQLHPGQARPPEPGKLPAIERQRPAFSLDLSVEHRPPLLNLNRNYTGLVILKHLSTLNPRVSLYSALQSLFVEGQEAGVLGDGGPGVGFGVHGGAFDPYAGNGEAQVGDDHDGGGSGDGDEEGDQDRAQVGGHGLYLGAPSFSRRSSPTPGMSPAPRVGPGDTGSATQI